MLGPHCHPATSVVWIIPVGIVGGQAVDVLPTAQQGVPMHQGMPFLDVQPAAGVKDLDADMPVQGQQIIQLVIVPVRMGYKSDTTRGFDRIDGGLGIV